MTVLNWFFCIITIEKYILQTHLQRRLYEQTLLFSIWKNNSDCSSSRNLYSGCHRIWSVLLQATSGTGGNRQICTGKSTWYRRAFCSRQGLQNRYGHHLWPHPPHAQPDHDAASSTGNPKRQSGCTNYHSDCYRLSQKNYTERTDRTIWRDHCQAGTHCCP